MQGVVYAFVGVCAAAIAVWPSPTNDNELNPAAGEIPALTLAQHQQRRNLVVANLQKRFKKHGNI
ncbi:MAG: hypothetical protein JJE22_03760 [Bacteroidia bacterium]|nr:hypothetical protein [Bacteroidia bacterium]